MERLLRGEFYGRVAGSHDSHGFYLSETVYQIGQKVPTHAHELAYFCLLLDGGYVENYGKRTEWYEPFSVAYHPPEEIHHGEISKFGGRCFNIEIDDLWMDRLRELARIPDGAAELRGGELAWLATRAYREYRTPDTCSPLAIEGLVLEMLAVTARREQGLERRRHRWLADVTDILHAEFRSSLLVRDVASRVGVHPVHLSRVFRRHYGRSLGEYVRNLRVQFAMGELSQQPELGLAEVALMAGFADQSHFSRVFKEATGTTPGEFRNRLSMGAERF